MEATIDALIADLRGEGDILYPGEPEEKAMAERLAQGVPIDAEALRDMHAWSAKLGVPPPTDRG
jgi:LDH2 family malate/lactate/ureidoglycolate dehydrogenase